MKSHRPLLPALLALLFVALAGPSLLRAQPAGPAASGSAPAGSAPTPAGSAPASSAPAPTASAPAAPPPAAPPPMQKKAPAAPDPTPDQIAALAELQKEAETYEAQAKEYRSTITRIVKHHYEDRKRRILTSLDREIAIEKKGLIDAREEAIRRLEVFIERYSGPNAHPENTPDAMFRLGALYEERARADETEISDEELARRLQQAITLYKRIIVEFPKYRELAGVYYYLGHALNDSNRKPEAQQVWRSLVCKNQYPYPVEVDKADPNKDVVHPLPQDHDEAYWREWERRHPEPIKGGGKKAAPRAAPKPGKKTPADDLTDETVFQNPFPSTCVPIPQRTALGMEPRYVAEVWWLIGDYHFNELGVEGGAFNYNRAQAAYTNSMQYKKPPIFGVSMYKLAWTYFKQQRFKQSVLQFVDLLRYADEQEKLTGDAGSDFRSEAYTYIAGSLTYLDFDGPGPDEPYIPRNDVLDTETDPRKQEQKMHVAIDRVQDETLIPQKEKWTVEIYKALALEFKELNQYRNTIEVSQLILQKWPLDCGAPVVQNQIAEIYDTMTRQSKEGTPEYEENSRKALEARTKLADYVGPNKPWTRACINDPEAIQTAERLVRGGLRRAAADHTNAGRASFEEGARSTDKAEREQAFERAIRSYQLAAQGWEGYLSQDENSSDAYESRYWLADANHMIVVLTVLLERSPTEQQIAVARQTAVAVRDSNEDSKFLQPAAFFVVDVAFQQLQDQYRRHKASSGAEGIELRDGLKFEGEGEDAKYVKEPIPPAVLATMQARQEYIDRIPESVDVTVKVDEEGKPTSQVEGGWTMTQAKSYEWDIANYHFVYGDFPEAKKRFTVMYEQQCAVTPFGIKAWDWLRSMALFEKNAEETRRLGEAVEKKPCGLSAEQREREKGIALDTFSAGFYADAYKSYQEAEKLPEGEAKQAAWRKSATLYKSALEKAPGRDEAPEAAIYGAKAFRNVSEFDESIAMYNLFIREYGKEDTLAKLEKGDAKEKAEYTKRLTNLKYANDELAKTNVLFFNYRAAAEQFDIISRNKRFTQAENREAARKAVILYASIGDDDKLVGAQKTLYASGPSVQQKTEIDYLVAEGDLKKWDQNAADEGGNRAARARAASAMENYYNKNKGTREASQYLVNSAYHAAKAHRAGGETGKARTWCANTTKAFETFKAAAATDGKGGAMGSAEADMAAECAFLALDEELKAKWDYDTGHHRYTGVVTKVKENFEKDLTAANDVWFPKLQAVIEAYASKKWSVAVRSRQGSLYDSVRTGLYNATPPAVKLYTDKEEKLLKMAETSEDDALILQADEIRQRRREEWRAARERSFDSADKAMVKLYTESVVWAKAYRVRTDAVDHAVRRLAFFTDIIGNAKMRDFSLGVLDPESNTAFTYTDNIFLRTRPGLTVDPAVNGMPSPLPAAP